MENSSLGRGGGVAKMSSFGFCKMDGHRLLPTPQELYLLTIKKASLFGGCP